MAMDEKVCCEAPSLKMETFTDNSYTGAGTHEDQPLKVETEKGIFVSIVCSQKAKIFLKTKELIFFVQKNIENPKGIK